MGGQAASYYGANQSFQQQAPPGAQGYSYNNNGINNDNNSMNNYHNNPNDSANDHQNAQEPKQSTYNPAQSNQAWNFDVAFKVDRPKYNDIWAGLLLIAVFCGYVAVSGVAIQKYSKYKSFNGNGIYGSSNDFSLNTNTIILFIFVLVVAGVLSKLYFYGARFFTKQFIWATGILNIVIGLGTAIYYLYRKQYYAGVVFLVFAVFALICFISWIPRIPFSVVMLQTAMDVARGYGHVFIISAVGGIVAIAFSAWFSVTLVAIYVAYEPDSSGTNPSCANGGCSTAKVIGLVFYVTFAMYWLSEWLKNTIHTTVAGIYGSWYFWSATQAGIPKGMTRGAFRRAITYSFGSISFGSLITAIINMLRQLCSVAQRQEAAAGNIVGSIFLCILGFFISILNWLVTFFNRYAFCHIALYGRPYVPAAKDTWAMMKDRGIDALVNDCLIGPVLSMGSIFVSYVCALLAYLYLEFTHPAYNTDNKYTPVIMAFAFVIGLQICQIFLTPISSGVDTIFVAMGWNPEIMMRDHPQIYERLVHVYPRVRQLIHV